MGPTMTESEINFVPPVVGGTILRQFKTIERRFTVADTNELLDTGNYRIIVRIRHDDECRNGHETFSITADVYRGMKREPVVAGCCHDIIARYVPELEPLIKWHQTSSDGPMHYISNTVFHASDRNCWGKRRGEASSYSDAVQFGENPIKHKLSKSFAKFLRDAGSSKTDPFDLEVLAYHHENRGDTHKYEPKYTFGGYASKWHECPFDTESEALDFLTALKTCDPKFLQIATAFSEGKERDLAAARSSAIWPEATDEELMTEPAMLTLKLQERLPALIAEFRGVVEGLGFKFTGLEA